MTEAHTWDPTGPLPCGTTLLEASAGTGKTWTIEALVLRLVAETAIPVDRLLVVTYTRAATAELGDRIRRRLRAALEAFRAPQAASSDDPVVAHLLQVAAARDDVAGFRARLRQAIEAYDQATISTIHGFCQRVLQQHAFESRAALDAELVEDVDDLIAEVADDLYATDTHDASVEDVQGRKAMKLDPDGTRALVKAAVSDPDRRITPSAHDVEADLPSEARALVERLDEEGDALVEAIEAAKSEGRFRKRTTTYSGGKAEERRRVARSWLASVAGGAVAPLTVKDAAWWSRAKRADYAAEGAEAFEHSLMDAVAAFVDRVGAWPGGVRAQVATRARVRFEAAKAQRGVLAFQDLLRQLAVRLGPSADPEARRLLSEAIRRSYDVALIDEFQDTDPHQWTIFRTVFDHPTRRLFLIGDPKQAIYGFRGANIHVYEQATGVVGDRQFTMTVNHRSDGALLKALHTLWNRPGVFGPTSFGWVDVDPSKAGASARLRPASHGAGTQAALQVRWLDDVSNKALGVAACAEVCAADVTRLLHRKDEVLDEGTWRRVRPGDVAVLVRTGAQAKAMQAALGALGVPAVLSGADSVLASDEAEALALWLDALASPRGTAARVAASTALFEWTAADLAALDREDPVVAARWDAWLTDLQRWRGILVRDGLLLALRTALFDQGVVGRLLARPGGARRLTNLLHLGELVHAFATERRAGLDAMRRWLAVRRMDDEVERDARELRLDRDDDAVQIMTVHKSKGLTVRFAFVPFAWAARVQDPPLGALVHAGEGDEAASQWLHVGIDKTAPATAAALAAHAREAAQEDVRLLYVAVTRARHQVVLYGTDQQATAGSALAWVLAGHPDGEPGETIPVDAAREAAEALAAHPEIAFWSGPGPAVEPWVESDRALGDLSVRPFTRGPLDPYWRRHSYSALSRRVGHDEVPEDRIGVDRDGASPADPGMAAPEPGPPGEDVPLAAFPGGAEAGTALHAILEHAEFTGVTSDTQALHGVVAEQLDKHGFDGATWADRLTPGIAAAILTPLGGTLEGLRLADLPKTARLDELRFDLSLAVGEPGSSTPVGVDGVLDVLASREAEGVFPAGWVDSLDGLRGVQIAGFLTGAIDLVFRNPRPGGRWWVVDHKSNKVAPRADGGLDVSAFRPEALSAEMARHHYFLQYHLYLVALHRLLRWRVKDYDYDRDVGGVAYLFVRGMVGPDTPVHGDRRAGVYLDRPSAAVVEALDRALGGVA